MKYAQDDIVGGRKFLGDTQVGGLITLCDEARKGDVNGFCCILLLDEWCASSTRRYGSVARTIELYTVVSVRLSKYN